MKVPYLVQRGEIREPIKEPRISLEQAVRLDFMGPAEFASWSLKKSIRAMNGPKQVLKAVNILDNSLRLHVLHPLTEKDFSEYFGYLMDMRIGKHPLLERAHFAICKAEDKKTTDFWWDIDNNVMWSFNEDFMKGLNLNIAASLAIIQKEDSNGSGIR